MRFGSTAKVLANCLIKYYIISKCVGPLDQSPFHNPGVEEILWLAVQHAQTDLGPRHSKCMCRARRIAPDGLAGMRHQHLCAAEHLSQMA